MPRTGKRGIIAEMKLFQHAEFEQAVLQAAEHFRARGFRPPVIEKDYYVTEALRIIAANGDKIIFKGGTSLAKGTSTSFSIRPRSIRLSENEESTAS